MKSVPLVSLTIAVALATCAFPGLALAGDELNTLRQQVEVQKVLIEQQRATLQAQQEQMDRQARGLEELSKRLGEMEQAASAPAVAQTEAPPPRPALAPTAALPPGERDDVGDLNAEAVKEGTFPGSFRIPGTRDVSLAIGGFVKAVAIYDSDAKAMGADFLPATLKPSDTEGAFSLDATLTRIHFDARVPLPQGGLRGYVEYDLNGGNNGALDVKMRHAYGTWATGVGVLTAGHTWSTFMDTKILPEGLTEPTLSGPIFARQSQLRWTQPLGPEWRYHIAIEDPSSDFSASGLDVGGSTALPDGVLGLEYDRKGIGHARLNGILRRLEANGAVDDAATAWGLALTGHLDVGDRDRLNLGGVYGKGIGRYLLGIQSLSGAAIDPVEGDLELRKNWGLIGTYLHHWSDRYRSTLMVGHARSEQLDWQPASTFENSSYAAVNLMWSPMPFLTLGVEYAYGKLENADDSDLDNHRLAVGMQFY